MRNDDLDTELLAWLREAYARSTRKSRRLNLTTVGDRTMPRGYNRSQYTLPFDHRGSFRRKMFGWTGALKPEQTAQINAAKKVIYDALKASVARGVLKQKAGILVGEQFGADILRDAGA